MEKDKQKGNSFGKFVGQLQALVLGLFGFVSAVVGFVILVQGNTGLVTIVLLALGVSLIWLACLYFARFWKPEQLDVKTGLILPPPTEKQDRPQRKKEKQRQVIRRAALVGLVIVPLMAIGSWIAWVQVRNLPSNDVIILVAEFDEKADQNFGVTERILNRLRDATEDYSDVKVEALNKTITEQAGGSDAALAIGKKSKASIVIWGWYTKTEEAVQISANFEVLQPSEYLPDFGETASGQPQVFALSELNHFQLQTRLSSEMRYLTLFTLGWTVRSFSTYSGSKL